MITVKKDKDVKVITKGVYENLYKHLGYTIVKPVVKTTETKKEENEGTKTVSKLTKSRSKGDDLE